MVSAVHAENEYAAVLAYGGVKRIVGRLQPILALEVTQLRACLRDFKKLGQGVAVTRWLADRAPGYWRVLEYLAGYPSILLKSTCIRAYKYPSIQVEHLFNIFLKNPYS